MIFRAHGRNAGSVVVEFALLAPLIGSLLIAMFELSRGIMVREVLSDAARKGCRTGILPARTNANVSSDINDILTDNNIPTANAKIIIKVNDVVVDGLITDLKTAEDGDKISVQVYVPVADIYWVTKIFLNQTNIYSETFVMMRQG